MTDIKIGNLIRSSTPVGKEKPPRLTEEQIEKLQTVGKIALAIVAGAGIVTLTAIAPNIWWAVDRIFKKKYPHRKYTKREKDLKISQAFYYMKRSGLIKMRLTGNDFKIAITRLGRKKYAKLNLDTLSVKKPKSWDGKWWQVAADIPTKHYRYSADLLRQKLKDMNFYPLQRTLWFYPYDPRKEIEFIVYHYGIERFVTMMEINRLDRDDEQRMKAYFQELKIIKPPEIR